MKKIFFILWLVIACISCADHAESFDSSHSGQEDKVKIALSVVLPEVESMSRSLGKTPSVDSLCLAVFDKAGYLLQSVEAEIDETNSTESIYAYTAVLKPDTSALAIHFIANVKPSFDFGSETEVITKLSTENNQDAYWQRVELTGGINSETQLTGVRLIRNFAWIQLNVTDNKFKLESYCVVNTMNKGSVAPYNTAKRQFETYPDSSVSHAILVANGYDAFIPEDAVLTGIPTQWTTVSNPPDANSGYFIYERETPKSNPPYILMKGTYNGKADCYYKVDLRDSIGSYFPILRNFKYTVNVTKITHDGYDSAEEASGGIGSGDVSTDVNNVKYTNISDGKVRLYVSYTDTTLVSTDDICLKYKFVSLDNKNVSLNGKDVNGKDYVTISQKTNGPIISKNGLTRELNDDTNGWRTIAIKLDSIELKNLGENQILNDTITLIGKYNGYSVQRQVRLSLRRKQKLYLMCEPNEIANIQGRSFDLVMKMPDGLGSSMFPLDFYIEAAEQSITPNGDNLPVETRRSIVPNKTKPAIGFIKSVSRSEYETAAKESGYVFIPCHFKSNRAESQTYIYAQNKYFDLEERAYLGNYIPKEFEDLAFTPESITTGVGADVTFRFDITEVPPGNKVIVTLDGLEPIDGSGLQYFSQSPEDKPQYTFTVNEAKTYYLLLKTTAIGTAKVTLEADQFITASKDLSVSIRYVIPVGNIKISNDIADNTTVTFYGSDPGTDRNPKDFLDISFNVQDKTNPREIDVANIYQENRTVYLRYYTGNKNSRTYYVVSVNLSDLLKKQQTLTFTPRN